MEKKEAMKIIDEHLTDIKMGDKVKVIVIKED